MFIGLAASLMLAAAIYWLWPVLGTAGQTFATNVGEQRTIALADGSIVQLNTSSHIRVSLSDTRRDIRLLDGEAIFKVHHDPARPFRVHTANAVIQAIGTQFNVHSGSARTKVSVLEGAVRISMAASSSTASDMTVTKGQGAQQTSTAAQSSSQREARLVAGEEASIATGGQIVKVNAPDVADTIAWQQRRLVFRADSLADIAAEFNRYNRTPHVRLNDTGLAQRRYTGTFDADDPGALALLLSREPDLTIDSTASEIVVHYRR